MTYPITLGQWSAPSEDRCPFCKQTRELTVLVDLQGTLTLVCEVCYDRGEEAANVGDDPE